MHTPRAQESAESRQLGVFLLTDSKSVLSVVRKHATRMAP